MSEDSAQVETRVDDASYENFLMRFGAGSELLMDVLELITALIMVGLFAIGVYDLGLKMYLMITGGTYTDPEVVIQLIDTALLLLIIVEIYRTVIAYVEDLNILPIVLNVGIIAMSRKIISFRTTKYATPSDALIAGLAYGVLLVIVVVAFYLIHRIQQDTTFNIFAAGEAHSDTVADNG